VVVVVVPSAKELAEKFLEVVRLWTPILEKTVLHNNTNPSLPVKLQNAETPAPVMELLPETVKFRQKARTLSAWLQLKVAEDTATPLPPTPPRAVGVSPGRRSSVSPGRRSS
ncbi:unnamed protein product, partial [Laminaria digitata]